MGSLYLLLAAVIKALIEALINKPIDNRKEYRDARGDPDDDDVFSDDDW